MADNQDDIYKYQPLWENWYIDMPIGKGSFGSVYKISREDMGHKYTSAVKIISIPSDEQYKEAEASLGGDEASLSGYFESIVHNLVNEINMLYSLKGNSNIVNYEDHRVVKKEDSVGWDILIRMEYVTSLKKYIASHQMSKREIIKLGIDICSALELCSNRGIIHRDIKDDNIFVNQDGVFKLGDFGISKELSKSGRAASMRGTPLYMAPEVYRGDKYDAAVDIYSLGIVMYKLLNHGRMPFMPSYPETILFKDSEAALEKRISGQKLPLPDQAVEALGNVILKACAYQAGDRYATATEMKRDLEKVLSSLPDVAKDELVTMLNIKSTESASTKESSLTSQPQPKDKTVSIFGAGLAEPVLKSSDNLELELENSLIKSIQESTESLHRDLNKTESIFATKSEPVIVATDAYGFFDQPREIIAGSKKSSKPSKAVVAVIAATVVFVLIFVVAMNREDASNQTSSQLAQTSTDTLNTQSPQKSSNSPTTQSDQTSINSFLIPKPDPDLYVLDQANVLSEQTRSMIINSSNELNSLTKAQVAVVTLKTLDGLKINDVSLAIFNKWGLGDKKLNNGILIILVPSERQVRIEVGYGLEKVITDTIAGQILDQYMVPSFKNGNFDQGLEDGYEAVVVLIAKEYGVKMDINTL